jgi:hypothetical protein
MGQTNVSRCDNPRREKSPRNSSELGHGKGSSDPAYRARISALTRHKI